MDHLLTYALTVFTGFFAVMNPIANISVFLGLVEGQSRENQKNIAKTAYLTAFFIVTVFVIAGKYVFELFGITIPAFKITGGILIFYVGFEMLMSQKSKIQGNLHSEERNNIAISPLATPILAGPGTIVTAINNVTNENANLLHMAIVVGAFALIIFISYLAFSLSDSIAKRLGANFISVIGKHMGLILAIIGTGMVTEGIKLAFKWA